MSQVNIKEIGSSFLSNWKVATPALFASFLLYRLLIALYNIYLHPLSGFPGPRLWTSSVIFRHVSAMRGQLDWTLLALHEQYGDVVRFSPDELSFQSKDAWRDIYGHKEVPLAKDEVWYNAVKMPDQAASIFNASHNDHARIRKQLSHAFSEKAIREQEHAVEGYVDLLIEKLKDVARAGVPADMVKWYNFTTFDMIGDLALGKSFSCLNNSEYHSWVASIFKSIKIGPFVRTIAAYTDAVRVLRLLAPRSVQEARAKHERYVRLNGEERLSKGVMEERRDFISYILKHQEKDQNRVTDKEIIANCNFLLLAGSETTATALSGLTFHLLKTPIALERITNEIRSAFTTEAEINFLNATARLPYTMACIHEALRIYPPGPNLFPRRTPNGRPTSIAGYIVPGGTSVGVHALSATHSDVNFHKPFQFEPERWRSESIRDPASPFHRDHREASQPFSVGPRNCLGQSLAYNELRVIIAKVLWNFDLTLCEESEDWSSQITYTLWEKPPLWCRLSPVQHAST